VTRDYRLELDDAPGPKLLSVFGGKLTTARALALEAMDELGVGELKFTASTPLPGGDIDAAFNRALVALATWMPEALVHRLSRAYGTRLDRLLDGAASMDALGRHFGAGLYEREVRYLVEVEWARTAEDVLWRRTKLGLELSAEEVSALEGWMAENAPPS